MRFFMCALALGVGCAVQPGTQTGAPAPTGGAPARAITVNAAYPSPAQLSTLEQLEASYAVHLADGGYWYDPMSGAFGRWGGPVEAVIPAGLDLGPPLPADASAGNTHVVLNGRVLPSAEVAFFESLIGQPIAPGRYFLDGEGNVGQEGGPATANLVAIVQQRNQNKPASHGGTTSVYGGEDHTGRASWFESDGRCRYIETPSGGFSSGCSD